MQLYFIRHAQSENNALWDLTGASNGRSDDPILTETGIEQAQRVAEFLSRFNKEYAGKGNDPQNRAGFDLTHLYCSLMLRSVQTGSAIARATGLPLRGWKELHETGGIYLTNEKGEREGLPGKTRDYFEETYPDFMLPESVTHEGWWNREYELEEEHLPRARMVLQTLLEKHGETDDRVALVSHGGFYNIFLTAVMNLSIEQHVWFSMNNVGITRVDFRPDGVYVIYMNRVDFLPDSLLT